MAEHDEAWVDRHGDVWRLGDDGLMHTPETAPFPREHVEKKWGPLRLVPDPAADLHRVRRTPGALYAAPKQARRRRICNGHLNPVLHWIEPGQPVVYSALPPDHPDISNDGWMHAAYCADCAPTPEEQR